MSISLTRRQEKCFEFIVDYIGDRRVAPSFQEIQHHLGIRSKSGVHRIIKGLEDRGLIRRLPNRARAIEVLALANSPISASTSFVVDPLPDVRREIERYAASHRISVKAAAEEALRAYFVERT